MTGSEAVMTLFWIFSLFALLLIAILVVTALLGGSRDDDAEDWRSDRIDPAPRLKIHEDLKARKESYARRNDGDARRPPVLRIETKGRP